MAVGDYIGVIKAFSIVGFLFLVACTFAVLRNRGYLVRFGVRPADPLARELERGLHPHPYTRPISGAVWKEDFDAPVVVPELREVELMVERKEGGAGSELTSKMEDWMPLSMEFASNNKLALTFWIVGPREGEGELLDFGLDFGTLILDL